MNPTAGTKPASRLAAEHAGASAPLCSIEGVLTPSECDDLVRLFDLDGGEASAMPGVDGAPSVVDLRRKARRDLGISGPLSDAVRDRMVQRVLPAVVMTFRFRPSGFEALKLVRYEAGCGWFAPHRDNVAPAARHRRVAVSLNLATGSYEGGALSFPELADLAVDPPLGAALVFDGSLLHAVQPVTRGARYALVTFLW